ncbi:MAG: hypothetical protein IJX17_01365 [Clostridia bacterium]|nr:hypothetical protein [Clostridia bacterium]
MEKKSVSATILVLFLALTFSVIGICFSVFVYKETRILIDEIKVVSSGIKVYGDKELKNEAKKLELSNIDLGLKPATGKIDKETQIPSTITDEETSEGCYACVYVPSGINFKITIKDIKIDTENNINEVNEGRDNIFVAIKEVSTSVKTLEDNEIELATYENINETTKITFLVWLGSMADKELVGSKISFTLSFDKI